MIRVSNHPLSIVFRFHYHSQKVIGSQGWLTHSHLSSVFWLCGPYTLGDIPTRSFRGVKGSLRGGVLFGVAYAGGYARTARIILSANLKKSALRQLWLLSRYLAFCGFISFYFGLLWLHFLSFWPFVASFTFILAFCAFHKSVWFVLLRDQWLLPSYLRKRGGPMAGAISCLRGAYAEVTQRLRGGSW